MANANDTVIPAVPDGPKLPPISIVYGHVRVATVYTWSGARAALRQMINDAYARTMHSALRDQRHQRELAQVAAGPQNGMLVTSGAWAWADSLRWAADGGHGLTAGDLATVHEHSNGSRYAYTIDVKCKIIAVTPGHPCRVTVRITGDSAQFTRGDTLTVPAHFIRPRPKAGR